VWRCGPGGSAPSVAGEESAVLADSYQRDELDDLYGEYLFMPAELGVDFADDDPVFINVFRSEIGRAVPENFHVPFSPGSR
jgi:hypothetical protein